MWAWINRWLCYHHWHRMRFDHQRGGWRYYECAHCPRRVARPVHELVNDPINLPWLYRSEGLRQSEVSVSGNRQPDVYDEVMRTFGQPVG